MVRCDPYGHGTGTMDCRVPLVRADFQFVFMRGGRGHPTVTATTNLLQLANRDASHPAPSLSYCNSQWVKSLSDVQ